MRKIHGAIAVLVLLILSGCGPDKGKNGLEEKAHAFISDRNCAIRLPRAWEGNLPNGLHLVVLEDHRLPKVTFRLYLPGAGGLYDPPGKEGLAFLTALAMHTGTTTVDHARISRLLERTASVVEFSTSFSSVNAGVQGDCLSGAFSEVFELVADIIFNPTFPENELELVKNNILGGLDQRRFDSDFLAQESFMKAVYGDHPAARTSCRSDAVKAITREDLLNFHKTRYVPDHAILGIVGDITPGEAVKVVTARLAGWKNTGQAAPKVAMPAPLGPARIRLIHRPRSVQTRLVVGTRGVTQDDPDAVLLTFLNQVLGSNSSRRLCQNLREKHAYAPRGCYSRVVFSYYPGAWWAATDVRSEWTAPALGEILGEIERIRTEKIGAEELDAVKRMTAGEYALSMESPESVLDKHLEILAHQLPEDYWDGLVENMRALSADAVLAAAAKFLAAPRIHIVAVGDAKKIAGALGKFGPVEIFDMEGRPLAGRF